MHAGVSLDNIIGQSDVDWKELGSMLFVRNVSGTRSESHQSVGIRCMAFL